MTTFVRAPEAARRLGVSTSTLYSYVSRGRVRRRLAADGRSSLFDVGELDALAERTRKPPAPPPTIDVRISTAVTQLDEDGLRYRDIAVAELTGEPFERVCDLLWSGTLDGASATSFGAVTPSGVEPIEPTIMGLIRLASRLTPTSEGDDPADVTRTLLATIPAALGSRAAARAPYAERLTRAWIARPSPQLVQAVNAALVLLADHELATSTLAVRVAASVRSSPAAALIAGLATVEGDLHGSAALHAHRLLERVAADGADAELARHRANRQRVAGFGHKIYRQRDPRFALLLDRVRAIPDSHGRIAVVDELLTTAGAQVSQHPNIDLALGALTYVAGFPDDIPLFAIARTAGWTAHYMEELDERPVRYRGLAR